MDGGSCPWGHSIHHAIAGPNGVPLLPVQLGRRGAELVIFAFLLWHAGRPPGRGQMPGLCVLPCPGAVCAGVVSGDPARGMYGPFSTSQWLSLVVLALPWRGLWRGGSSKNTSVKGYPSKRATETRAIQRIHKNHRKEETARADAPKRAAGSGCLNFRFHDSRRTFRQDLFYI